MTVSQRVRLCRMAEGVRMDREYAERMHVKDRSHFRDEDRREDSQYTNARSGVKGA